MSKLFALFAFALILFTGAPASAQSANLSGDWRGIYFDGAQTNVPFDADLVQRGDRLSGTITEPNTFGAADVRFLLANIEGSAAGAQISFSKTYDGTGGESHTVRYTGTLMPNGRRIVGSWQLDGGTQGGFEMVR
jgi:hypothetical protein